MLRCLCGVWLAMKCFGPFYGMAHPICDNIFVIAAVLNGFVRIEDIRIVINARRALNQILEMLMYVSIHELYVHMLLVISQNWLASALYMHVKRTLYFLPKVL